MKKIIVLMLCATLSGSAFANNYFKRKPRPSNELRARIARLVSSLYENKYAYGTRFQNPPSAPNLPGFSTSRIENVDVTLPTSEYLDVVISRDANDVPVLSYRMPQLSQTRLHELRTLMTDSQGKNSVLMFDSANRGSQLSQLDQLVLFSYHLDKEGQKSPILERFKSQLAHDEFGDPMQEVTALAKSPIDVLDVADGSFYTIPAGYQIATRDLITQEGTGQTGKYNVSKAEENIELPKLEETTLRATGKRSFLMPQELQELLITGYFGQPQVGIYTGGHAALMVKVNKEFTAFDGKTLIQVEAGDYLQLPLQTKVTNPNLKGVPFPNPEAKIYNITPNHTLIEDFAYPELFIQSKKGVIL